MSNFYSLLFGPIFTTERSIRVIDSSIFLHDFCLWDFHWYNHNDWSYQIIWFESLYPWSVSFVTERGFLKYIYFFENESYFWHITLSSKIYFQELYLNVLQLHSFWIKNNRNHWKWHILLISNNIGIILVNKQ